MAVDPGAVAHRLAMDWLREQVWLAQNAPAPERPRRRYLAPNTFSDDDVLATIAPALYIEALTGEEISDCAMVSCPLPDHEDRTPSFRAYDDPERGWYCFGCNRGGAIYDFAGALRGIPTRGASFTELRDRLAAELLGRRS
jgi:CHC2 zinc finger